MKASLNRVRTFFQEARRRKLVGTSLLFGGGAYGLLSVLDVLARLVPTIDRVLPYLVLTSILAFPVVLVLAWAFDITSEGIKLTRSQDGSLPPMATRLGAILLPAMPGFYHRPSGLDELVDQLVGKVLDRLRIESRVTRRWTGPDEPPAEAGTEGATRGRGDV